MNLMCCRFGTPGDVVPQRRVNRCIVCVWYGSGGDREENVRAQPTKIIGRGTDALYGSNRKTEV